MLRSLPNSVHSAIAFVFLLFSLALPVSSQESTSKGSETATKTTDSKVFSEPRVARDELRLTIGEQEADMIEKGDGSEGTLVNRAAAYKIKSELEQAIADFTKAIELSPNFIPATMGRGYVYFRKGDHEHAIADFTRMIELNGRAAVAFNNRGYNYQQIGKFQEAIADFNQAIALTPKYALAHPNLAWVLALCQKESLRNPKEAVASATRACELNQYNDLSDLVALAASHAAFKEFAMAIGLQEKIIEKDPQPQKPVAEKILELYENEKPFNLELAVTPTSENEKSIETQEGKKQGS